MPEKNKKRRAETNKIQERPAQCISRCFCKISAAARSLAPLPRLKLRKRHLIRHRDAISK
jgi:hypothetical protein